MSKGRRIRQDVMDRVIRALRDTSILVRAYHHEYICPTTECASCKARLDAESLLEELQRGEE